MLDGTVTRVLEGLGSVLVQKLNPEPPKASAQYPIAWIGPFLFVYQVDYRHFLGAVSSESRTLAASAFSQYSGLQYSGHPRKGIRLSLQPPSLWLLCSCSFPDLLSVLSHSFIATENYCHIVGVSLFLFRHRHGTCKVHDKHMLLGRAQADVVFSLS